MNLLIALDQTEEYLNQNRTTIPDMVLNYISNVIKQDRQCIELVNSMKQAEPGKNNSSS